MFKKSKKAYFSMLLVVLLIIMNFAPLQAGAVVEKKVEKEPFNLLERLNPEKKEQQVEIASKYDQSEKYLSEDTLIVKYDQIIPEQIHRQIGTTLVKRFSSLGYDVVKVSNNRTLESVMKAYEKVDNVKGVAPSALYKRLSVGDPKIDQMYHLSLLNIDRALELAGDHEVTVAVIDSGLDTRHPELKNQILPGYNAYEPMRRGVADIHGTHVAAIIAAEANNGIGGKGVNPNAKILPIDVFNGSWWGLDYVIAEGILYAIEQNVDVINMSLGGWMPSPLMEAAVEKAIEAGITVVAAAGNSGSSHTFYPAGFDGVISVGATNNKNELAFFSTYGPSVNIVAPGEDIYNAAYAFPLGSTFMELSGTSMASPIVAGVASLLLSKHPDLTPFEVSYILQQTAKDLGDPGYDHRYGFGLVDPVAALKFDVSKLPTQPERLKDEKEIYEQASLVQFKDNKIISSGGFTLPGGKDWIQFDVEKGDFIQIVLEGAEEYDYQYTLHFYTRGEKEASDSLIVNRVGPGLAEANLYEVTIDGSIAIGVRDTNEQYSLSGDSTFSLFVERFDRYLGETIEQENPVQIEQLPYSSAESKRGPFYLAGQDGDSDYFSFTAEEHQIVEIELSAIPGVDPRLNVYFAHDLNPEFPEDMPKEFIDQMKDEMRVWPLEQSNRNGTSEGEILVFEAMPGIEYILEVTSEEEDYFYYDPFFRYFFGEMFDQEINRSANIPYELSIRAEVLPPDEDGYPMGGGMYFDYDDTFTEDIYIIEQYMERRDLAEEIFGGFFRGYFFDEEMINQIVNSAREHTLGTTSTGYFQYNWDIDLFKLEPTVDAIYKFEVNETETIKPIIEIMEYDEENNRLTAVAMNNWFYFYGSDDEANTDLYVGLEKGKTYIVNLGNGLYQPSLDEYTFKSSIVLKNPQDAYESNNKFKDAKPLPNYSFTGNLVMPGDLDIFYFKPGKNDIYGFNLEVLPVPKHRQNGLPEEIFGPIDPVVVIFEDTNGNGKLDEKEKDSMIIFDRGWSNEGESGSFRVKKSKGYFIVISNYYYEGSTVTPYRMTVAPVNRSDEDANSVVRNNVPSKPIKFNKVNNNRWSATGYMNAGIAGGDVDYYELNLPKDGQVKITYDVPNDINGVLALYDHKGKLIEEVNYYGYGDAEIIQKRLKKGKYYISVTDANGNPSLLPYTLNVELLK